MVIHVWNCDGQSIGRSGSESFRTRTSRLQILHRLTHWLFASSRISFFFLQEMMVSWTRKHQGMDNSTISSSFDSDMLSVTGCDIQSMGSFAIWWSPFSLDTVFSNVHLALASTEDADNPFTTRTSRGLSLQLWSSLILVKTWGLSGRCRMRHRFWKHSMRS